MFTKKSPIGIDLDDVVIDFNTALCEWHNRHYGTACGRDEVVEYHLAPRWNCSAEEAVRRCNEFCFSKAHASILPVSGAAEAMRALKQNHFLVAISSRPEEMRGLTIDLLRTHGLLQFGDMYFLGHYHDTGRASPSKAEICKRIGVKVCIDDSLSHVQDITAAGIPALLFDCPWNQGELPTFATRVFSWSDILREIV